MFILHEKDFGRVDLLPDQTYGIFLQLPLQNLNVQRMLRWTSFEDARCAAGFSERMLLDVFRNLRPEENRDNKSFDHMALIGREWRAVDVKNIGTKLKVNLRPSGQQGMGRVYDDSSYESLLRRNYYVIVDMTQFTEQQTIRLRMASGETLLGYCRQRRTSSYVPDTLGWNELNNFFDHVWEDVSVAA